MSNNWYMVYGGINSFMTMVGLYIYITYHISIESADRSKHPYVEWFQTSLFYLLPYGSTFTLWAVNLATDHNGGLLDRIFVYSAYTMQVAPVCTLFMGFYAGSSYGSEKQVALSTDWATVIDDDPKYGVTFNTTLWSSLLTIVMSFMSTRRLYDDFSEKLVALEVIREAQK